jgi:hypothetical protein
LWNRRGTVTWTDNTRVLPDLGFGQFSSTCWGDSPATSAGARLDGFVTTTDMETPTHILTAASGNKITIAWKNMGMQEQLLSHDGANWPTILTNKDLYYIKMGWFLLQKKNIKYLGLEQLSKLAQQ